MSQCSDRTFRATNSRKLLVLVLACLVTTVALPASAQAQTVTFNPASGSVDCAETMFVDVELDGSIPDVRGFTFTFQFDPTYVTPVSVQAGALVTGASCEYFFRWVNETSYVNTIQVDATMLGCSIAGPGSIIRIEFAPGPQRGQSSLTTLSGVLRDSANATISFTPPSGSVENLCNTAPVATDDVYTTPEDTAVGGNVITDNTGAGVDSDVDLDALTINTTPFDTPDFGGVVLNADGSFTYTPNLNFNGTDSFQYTLDDGYGGTDDATVTITINPVNDPPVAEDDAFTTAEDILLNGDVLAANPTLVDSDVDGDALTVVTTPVSGPSNGSLVLNSNGVFEYTPALNFFGTDQFVYTVGDGNGGTDNATVTITVSSVNDPPTAVANNYTTTEDTPVGGNVITDDTGPGVDSDIEDAIGLLTVNTTPVSGPSNGGVVLNADGSFTYTPNLNFNGTDTFDYELIDTDAGVDVATVTIDVTSVNDDPIATDDVYTTLEDTAVGGNVILDDTGAGVDSDSDGGTLTISITPFDTPDFGGVVLNADGSFTYTPNLNFNGTDTFQYTLLDGQTGSDVGLVTITVTPVNDDPVVTNPGPQTNVEYDAITPLQIVASDVDVGDVLSYSATGLPSGLGINASTGEISGQIDCSTAGPYTVTVTVGDGTTTVDTVFGWTVNVLPTPGAIADLGAAQLTSGNDVDGTTKITLSWTGVSGTHTVKVFRHGWGGYPEYDDTVAGPPSTPTDYAAAVADVDWVETAVTASGQVDEVATRDFWYYVAFVFNECGTVSAVSNQTGGTLNYHLGDVSNGVTAPAGNNAVSLEDISYLGFHYGVSESDGAYVPDLDIGPTTDLSVSARPTTDNQIQFEDLILFGINYNSVDKFAEGPRPSLSNQLTAFVDEETAAEDQLDVGLWLEGDGRIQGMSVLLEWDAAVVEPMDFAAGDILTLQNGRSLVLSPEPGTVDATLFGVRKNGISGEGLLATVHFRRLSAGDAGIGIAEVIARTAENKGLKVDTDVQFGSALHMQIPKVTAMHPVYPNPFNPATTVSFDLAREGRALIQIYAVNGRLVRTLVDEILPAGVHQRVWDGTDAQGRRVSSGAYVARMIAVDTSQTRRMVLIK